MKLFRCLFPMSLLATSIVAGPAHALPVLDGSGFTNPGVTVNYLAGTPESNYGAPTTTTDAAAYEILTKSDANYAYVLVEQTGTGGTSVGTFANLYFGTGASYTQGSDLGFEVNNSDAFYPGGSGTVSTLGQDVGFADLTLNGHTAIEFAVGWDYLDTDPQDIGFDKLTPGSNDLMLRLSQSFGYSVAGGLANFPGVDLGVFAEPAGAFPSPEIDGSSAVLPAAFLLGIGLVLNDRRRRLTA